MWNTVQHKDMRIFLLGPFPSFLTFFVSFRLSLILFFFTLLQVFPFTEEPFAILNLRLTTNRPVLSLCFQETNYRSNPAWLQSSFYDVRRQSSASAQCCQQALSKTTRDNFLMFCSVFVCIFFFTVPRAYTIHVGGYDEYFC